jgi:hypothetical protein
MAKGTKPCCAAAAIAQVRYLTVNGARIGITNLDEILKSAKTVASDGEGAIRTELLRLVKIYNYVPSQAEKAYEDALYSEYLKTGGSHQ